MSDVIHSGRTGVIRPGPADRPRPAWLDHVAKLLPTMEPEWFSRFLPPDEGGRESAVLMLFGPPPEGAPSSATASAGDDGHEDHDGSDEVDDTHLILIERSHTMRTQPAQIAFPGGARDPEDGDLVETALREADEETGLDPAGVDVVDVLPSLYLSPSQFIVAPVLGWWRAPSPIAVRDPAEVHEVLSVPVRHLVDPAHRFTVTHPSGFVGPAFDLDHLLLWGFTAGIISRLLDVAGLAGPWDETRRRPLPARYLGRPS